MLRKCLPPLCLLHLEQAQAVQQVQQVKAVPEVQAVLQVQTEGHQEGMEKKDNTTGLSTVYPTNTGETVAGKLTTVSSTFYPRSLLELYSWQELSSLPLDLTSLPMQES
jgi:hypothetical protein